ncbi:hypothetical protein SADUNF_Sadunf06G0113100 [Salix dunnii]|uniref:RRP12 HEAT domain-containing protein n=1 Tax=Salix dunnii TaxID=1413687 RepID=A0A835MWY4_9ROSI|nr:hypothetical protein SADUNF_Sadunf06G0113100 [Salix dunnii]
MEGIEFDAPSLSFPECDFCDSILSRYSTSTQDDHHQLCAIIGTMSQELKDQNLPRTPVAYLGAACSSPDRLPSYSDHSPHVIDSLITIPSLVLPRISIPILKKKGELISNVLRVLKLNYSVTAGAVVSGLKCVAHLLSIRDSVNWDDISQLFGILNDYLNRKFSSYFMRETLKNLADMQRMSDEDFPYRKQLHKSLGSTLGAMGPEVFLSLLPLKLEVDDLSEVNVWLFPILKQYTVGARLSFFKESVLSMVALIKNKSRQMELDGRIISTRSADALVYSLWSLLPSFCNYPLDTAESFQDLEKTLRGALSAECDIRGIVCSALQVLVQQNKRIMEQDDLTGTEVGIAEQYAIAHYTLQVAADNLRVLRSSPCNLLTVLSGILMESPKDDGGLLQSTIHEFYSIADEEVVKRIYLKTMQKLLTVTQRATKAENSRDSNSMRIDDSSYDSRARLFDLAVSLLPGLDAEEINV